MAIGGNIKVTLSLDDAGFTVKTQQAAKGINTLNTEIKGFGSGLTKAETETRKLGTSITSVSKEFSALSGYAANASKSLGSLSSSGATLDKTTASLVKSFAGLQSIVSTLSEKMSATATGMKQTKASGDELTKSNNSLAASSRATADGMTRQERAAKNLGNAQQEASAKVKLSNIAIKDSTSQRLATELNANTQMVVNKQQALASMLRAEQAYQRSLQEARSRAMATQMRLDSGRNERGQFVKPNGEYTQSLIRQLQLEQQQVAALEKSVSLIGNEAVKMQEVISTTNKRNQSLREGLSLRERDLANITRYQTALQQGGQTILNSERARRAEIQQQNLALREQVGMVKNLGQLWGAMKIYQGEKAAVNEASQYQVNLVKARAMGLNQKEMADFQSATWRDSRNTPGLSVLDAQRAREAAMGGLAIKDQGQIDKTLPSAVAAAKNIQYMTGDNSKEGFGDLTRNLYGFVEMRQQQYDVEASKKSFDLVTKIVSATGGKIDIQDIETLMRRIGSTSNQLSDNGIRNLVALMDQMKVSGGGGGGGAGGVSNVGTMIKMFQAYGNGKTLSNKAVAEFTEAGVMNLDGLDPKKTIAAQRSLLKNAGFSNSKQLSQDPVTALTKIAEAAFRSMTSNPKQIKKYFGSEDADTNNEENRRAAMAKWGTSLGMTTTATNTLTTVADPRFQARAAHQNEMIQGSMNNQQMTAERMTSYKQAVDNFEASLSNLQVTMGTTLLPMLTKFFDGINSIVVAMQNFAQNNPFITQMTMIGGAVASAVLAFKGFTGMIGIVGRAGASLGLFGGQAALAAGAASSAGSAATNMLNPFNLMKTTVSGVGGAWGDFTTSIGGANNRLMNSSNKVLPLVGNSFRFMGTTIASTFSFVGKAFMRAIPFVGWLLLAWDLGGLLMNFEIGGAAIGDWLTNWMYDLYDKAKVWWKKFTRLFQDDASAAVTTAAIAEIEASSAKRNTEFDTKRGETQKKAAATKEVAGAQNKAAQDNAAAQQAINEMGGSDKPGFGQPVDVNWGEDGKHKRQFEDPFVSSMADMRSKTDIAGQKVTASIGDMGSDVMAEARTAFREKWIGGDFDPGHDPSKRQFKGADGQLNWNAKGAGGMTPEDWVKQYAAMKQAEDQLKAMNYARERGAAAETDFKAAMERTTGETGKQNRDILALERELARASERLKLGTADWNAWAAEKNKALEMKSGAVLVNFTADFAEGDRKSQEDLMPDGFMKQNAEMDTKIRNDREQYETLRQSHQQFYDKELEAFKAQLNQKEISQDLYNKKVAEATERYTASATKAETAFTQHVQVQNALRERATENSVEKLAREWQNTYAAIETMQASWANSFIDNMVTVFSGGRVEWKTFLADMAKDMLSAKLKETFSSTISSVFGGLGSLLKNTVFANASTAGAGGTGSSLWSGAASLFSGVATNTVANNATGSTGSTGGMFAAGTGTGTGTGAADATSKLATAADTANTALGNMTQNGIMSTIAGFGSYVISLFTGTVASTTKATTDEIGATAMITLTTSMFEASISATNLAVALTAAAAASTAKSAFADGGIMSSAGPMPLKKYANGGIANSPQLALFGEGRYNEAYVPLPDGRSIPVTMQGDKQATAGAGTVNSVMINIEVNNDGSGTTTSNGDSGSAKTWGPMAEKIKGIVMETIVTEKRPGGVLTK